jgi:hypothetical protein
MRKLDAHMDGRVGFLLGLLCGQVTDEAVQNRIMHGHKERGVHWLKNYGLP